jgi:glycosyltransferase involved in cell wall biosynthesis
MHILLIHQAFTSLDEPGGTRHYELSRYFAEHGHQVTIIASQISYLTGTYKQENPLHQEHQFHNPGITVLRAYTYPALHRSFFHRLVSFFSFMLSSFLVGMRVKRIDLVWGTSPPIFQGLTSWLLARLKRVPFLFEVRDLWPAFAVDLGILRQPLVIRASEWLESFLYNHADQVVVNSPGFIQHVQNRGAQKVQLIPNGADIAMFDPQADGKKLRQDRDLEGKFVALYAGAHGISNDLEVLLDSAEILKTQPEIILLLLGDGKEKPNLIAKSREMHLSNVRFLDPVPKADMPEYLAASNACIAILKPIRLYKTVYPNKVFDYMAAGRPVILAIDGVIKEVIENARAGIVVPPGKPAALAEAIRKLASNPDLSYVLGKNGRQYVEANFDRPILASKFLRLMENLVKEV